jgi:hypothetical protein
VTSAVIERGARHRRVFRATSMTKTPMGMLSRGVSGIAAQT